MAFNVVVLLPFASIHGYSIIHNTLFQPELLTSLAAYLILSSCLGDRFRGRISGISANPHRGVYDSNYLRTMTNSGASMSEQIELQEIMETVREESDRY